MEEKTKNRVLQNLADANSHLQRVEDVFNELQLDCNRNRRQYLLCDKGIDELNIAANIINKSDLALPLKIALNVNQLFSEDKQISTVIVAIVNSKRIFNSGAAAHLKLTV
jgi:flagellin-specific chaperone FliS